MKRLTASVLVAAACLATGTAHAMIPPPIRNEAPPEMLAPKPQSPMGTNLWVVADWSTQQAFRNFFKMSREWISGEEWVWNNNKTVKTTPEGWVASLEPGQVARTIFMTGNIASLFAGTYVVKYEGEGTIKYEGAAKLISGQSKPGLDMVEVPKGGENFVVAISKTNPSNPIRNIVVEPAGLPEQKKPIEFYPEFMSRLSIYSTIRFMDWMKTNDAKPVTWEQRPKSSDAIWSTHKGVPLEVMTALANQSQCDPWFNVSHLWDDEYIINFAKAADAQLDPERTIYIEHSNEVWNGIFPQATYAREQGVAKGLSSDEFLAQLRFHSERSVHIFKLFQQNVKPSRKLVRVMGGWVVSTWSTEQMLSWKDAYKHTDALAIAPYFGYEFGLPENAEKVDAMNVRDLMRDIRRRSIPETINFVKQQREMCDKFGVQLVAYEAGQHLVGIAERLDSEKLNKLFDDANRDFRMQSAYARYLNAWRDAGGGLMVNFTDCGPMSKWGRWGSLEYIDQSPAQAPKYNAVLQFAKSNQPWWQPLGKPAGQMALGGD